MLNSAPHKPACHRAACSLHTFLLWQAASQACLDGPNGSRPVCVVGRQRPVFLAYERVDCAYPPGGVAHTVSEPQSCLLQDAQPVSRISYSCWQLCGIVQAALT